MRVRCPPLGAEVFPLCLAEDNVSEREITNYLTPARRGEPPSVSSQASWRASTVLISFLEALRVGRMTPSDQSQ